MLQMVLFISQNNTNYNPKWCLYGAKTTLITVLIIVKTPYIYWTITCLYQSDGGQVMASLMAQYLK
jgi:hypothetical protein